jgi:hypothetical protein
MENARTVSNWLIMMFHLFSYYMVLMRCSRNRWRSTKGMQFTHTCPLTNSRGARHFGMATDPHCNTEGHTSAWVRNLQGPSLREVKFYSGFPWPRCYKEQIREVYLKFRESRMFSFFRMIRWQGYQLVQRLLIWWHKADDFVNIWHRDMPYLTYQRFTRKYDSGKDYAKPDVPKPNIYKRRIINESLALVISRFDNDRVLARKLFFFTKTNKDRSFVIRLVFTHLWGSPLKGTNIIGFQSHCRGSLARYNLLWIRDSVHSITRQFEGNHEKFIAICKGYLVRRKIRNFHSRTTNAIANTAFPRLGKEHIDGCDCLLPDPSRKVPLLNYLVTIVFGKHNYTPVLLVADYNTWLIKKNHNGHNLFCISYEGFYRFYSGTDCHLVEGEPTLYHGHNLSLLTTIRVHTNEFKIIYYCKNNFTQDLSDSVTDEHLAHLTNNSFIVPPRQKSIAHVSPTITSSVLPDEVKTRHLELVERNGVIMTREQKIAARKADRQYRALQRASGVKVAKSQLPIRFRGLTTQEYHEMVAREAEDAKAHFEAVGKHGLPQRVKEYLHSELGTRLWNQTHAFAVDRPDLAKSQLDKFNAHLKYLGLNFYMDFNLNLIEKMRKEKQLKIALQQKQIEANKAQKWEENRARSLMSGKNLRKVERKEDQLEKDVSEFSTLASQYLHRSDAWSRDDFGDDDDYFDSLPEFSH